MGYKVARPGGTWRYFETLKDAKAFAERVHQRTGHVVAIEKTPNWKRDGLTPPDHWAAGPL